MTKYDYKYFIPEHGGTIVDACPFTTSWRPAQGEHVAEEAAEHYHDTGGWEATWPITFELWTAEGVSLGRFKVEREAVPSFHATEAVEQNDAALEAGEGTA